MNKPIWIALLLPTISTLNSKAQYYYKDILNNQKVIAEKKALQERSIKTILVHSFEGNGDESRGFYCEKKISKDYRRIETYTKSNITDKSLLTAYYNKQDQLVETRDSSELLSMNTTYEYDEMGRLKKIISNSHSSDDDFSTRLLEEHEYQYDAKGLPVKMLRIRNVTDTADIFFTVDEKGNVIEEKDMGKNGKHYYFYYNEKNSLTDIVKFNTVKGKLLPDFTFEYNSAGQVTQMVTVEEGVSSDYFIWKYIYNDGLRIIEKCFSRENVLLGYFEYEYR